MTGNTLLINVGDEDDIEEKPTRDTILEYVRVLTSMDGSALKVFL